MALRELKTHENYKSSVVKNYKKQQTNNWSLGLLTSETKRSFKQNNTLFSSCRLKQSTSQVHSFRKKTIMTP